MIVARKKWNVVDVTSTISLIMQLELETELYSLFTAGNTSAHNSRVANPLNFQNVSQFLGELAQLPDFIPLADNIDIVD